MGNLLNDLKVNINDEKLRVENIAEKSSYLWTARHIAYFWPLPSYPHEKKKTILLFKTHEYRSCEGLTKPPDAQSSFVAGCPSQICVLSKYIFIEFYVSMQFFFFLQK